MRLRLLSVFLFACLAAGCGAPATTPAPTEPTVPAATATPSIAAQATATSRPSATARASLPPPTATADVAATVIAAQTPRTETPLVSPDGRWRAEAAVYDCAQVGDQGEIAYEELRLIEVAARVETAADSQTIYCGGVGAFGLATLYWSANSRYLYYTDARQGQPDGCGYWAGSVKRLDTTDMTLEALGGAVRSPDESMLAAWQGVDLVVWDVEAGDEVSRAQADESAGILGPIVWSPDSGSLVYLQVTSFCPVSGSSTVTQVDPQDGSAVVLVASEAPTFGSVAWDAQGALRLTDEHGDAWRYDFASGEVRR